MMDTNKNCVTVDAKISISKKFDFIILLEMNAF